MEHDDAVAKTLAEAKQGVAWISERLHGLSPGKGRRNVLAGALYDLVIEHHAGIVSTIATGAIASGFALLRAQFEALVRAGWIQLEASDTQVERFARRGRLPSLAQLVEGVEKHADFSHGMLGRVRGANLETMHGFTHGGMEQVRHRLKREGDGELSLQPNYPPEAVVELLQHAGTFALIALRQVARQSDAGKKVADEISAHIDGKEVA